MTEPQTPIEAGAQAEPPAAGPKPADEKSSRAEGAVARAASTAEGAVARAASTADYPFSVTVGRVYDGPLDLLLDLIRKQDIDIWDIPIARITAQFLAYVERLKETDVDNAGEFIYTASLLIHIKSRMLLPREPRESADEAEGDPRLELVERLLEHERFKNAAQMLRERQGIEAATWTRPLLREFINAEDDAGEIAADVPDLVRVFRDIMERLRSRPVLNVREDAATVAQMMDYTRRRLLLEDRPVALSTLLKTMRSENALVAMFLALLEMVRLGAVLLRQDANFGEVFIKKGSGFENLPEAAQGGGASS